VGIIDPLRPEAIQAVRIAHAAGIDVRMITGDHLVTAKAIGSELGLGSGGKSGQELAAADDATLRDQQPNLHVFGRVSPQDKLRLVQLQQSQGHVVAMTGAAVNDAAALKQADIGVAMGSGSEVSKQAAKMILTDDNFAALVHAVELGRGIYARLTAYIGYQLTQLFGLVSMLLLATALDVTSGVALLPLQVLFRATCASRAGHGGGRTDPHAAAVGSRGGAVCPVQEVFSRWSAKGDLNPHDLTVTRPSTVPAACRPVASILGICPLKTAEYPGVIRSRADIPSRSRWCGVTTVSARPGSGQGSVTERHPIAARSSLAADLLGPFSDLGPQPLVRGA
jgi:soluble P-type ATPase